MELISVVIPSFRQGRFLRVAAQSVLEQDYPNLELVIVDDKSNDSSLGVAAEITARDPRVRCVLSKKNGGLARARNIGLENSRGDYVLFLDSDDYLLPHALLALVGAMTDSITGTFGDWQYVTEDEDFCAKIKTPRPHIGKISKHNYTGNNLFICSAPLVKTEALRAIGGFTECLTMYEDFATWVRLLAADAKFAYCEQVTTTYRQRPNSMLRSGLAQAPGLSFLINKYWLETGNTLVSHNLDAFLDDESPISHGRSQWIRSTSRFNNYPIHDNSMEVPKVSRLLAETEQAVSERKFRNLPSNLQISSVGQELLRRNGLVLRSDDAVVTKADVVIQVTSQEGAYEAPFFVQALKESGISAAIMGCRWSEFSELWPLLSSETPLPWISRFDLSGNHIHLVLGSDTTNIKRREVAEKGKLVMRPTGVSTWKVGGTHAGRKFRNQDLLILRSQFEVAELSDRNLAPLPSALGYLDTSPHNDSIGIYINDSLIENPILDAWVQDSVVKNTPHCKIYGSKSVRQRLKYLRIEDTSSLFTERPSTVITNVCDEITLFEGLGFVVKVNDPSFDHTKYPVVVRRELGISGPNGNGFCPIADEEAHFELLSVRSPTSLPQWMDRCRAIFLRAMG